MNRYGHVIMADMKLENLKMIWLAGMMVAVLAYCSDVNAADKNASVPERRDVRERTYVMPSRILWTSCSTSNSSVRNAEVLLKPRFGQVSEGRFLAHVGCDLENRGDAASLLLDFGRELHGGVTIAQGHGRNGKVRVRFGESASEAMSEPGDRGSQKDHSMRDGIYELPWLGTVEIGQTGFRFVRIDLVTPGRIELESVRAVSLMRPMKQLGEFRCSDSRLTEIWRTAVRTVHLCCQDYLWDGIKRDRLVWMGDMHPEICAILAAYGSSDVVPESLDYILQTTPARDGLTANNLGTYTYWLVCSLGEWWRFTGEREYFQRRRADILDTLKLVIAGEDAQGRDKLKGMLDWPTHHSPEAERDGGHALRVMALTDCVVLADLLGDTELADSAKAALTRARSCAVDPYGENSAAALMALSGMRDPKEMFRTVFRKNGIRKFSTFYGYYMLEAISLAGEDRYALDIVRGYWGGMLDMGATSFWEDFDISWTTNSFRIDELPVPGKKDIHGDFGDFCYKGFRHSLCHGWSSGVAAWLTRRVLGVESLVPGGSKVRICPSLGDLSWVEGRVPLAKGVLEVRHERCEDGSVSTVVLNCPPGVEVVYTNRKESK